MQKIIGDSQNVILKIGDSQNWMQFCFNLPTVYCPNGFAICRRVWILVTYSSLWDKVRQLQKWEDSGNRVEKTGKKGSEDGEDMESRR